MAESAPVEVKHETQPAEGPSEAEQVNEFLADRGIELEPEESPETPEEETRELGEEDLPPPPKGKEAKSEEEAAEEPEESEETEENIPHLAKQLRDSKREQQDLEGEVQELKQYLNALLATASQPETGPNGQPAQPQPQEETEPPDIFEDPDGAIEHATRPLQERIQQLEGYIRKMSEHVQAGEQQNRHRQTVNRLRQIEDAYEEENPGYRDRLSRYGQIFVEDMQEDGFSREDAVNMLRGNIAAMARMAAQAGANPAGFIDKRVQRVLSGEKRPTQKDPGVEAAKRAKDDGVAESVASQSKAGSSNELTIDKIREAGIDPHMAGELFEKGGRASFLRAMREVEKTHSG